MIPPPPNASEQHEVRSTKGDGGVPEQRLRTQPFPGPRIQLPPGDMTDSYERASGHTLVREASWLAARDPLNGQPARQQMRMATIMAMWGSVANAWFDVVHNDGRAIFVPSFRVYRQFR